MMVCVASLLTLLLSVAAAASTDFDQRYPTCFLDRIEHCKHADGLAATFHCLDKNQGRLSPLCKASLEKSPAFQCSFDSMVLCPLANDHYDLMACLWTHRQGQLSSRCVGFELGHHHHDDSDDDSSSRFHECRQDKKKLCHGLSGFPRVMSCLADHENELSSQCRAAMNACPAFKCAHDAERFCPNAKSHHDFGKCIWDHRDEVSQTCKEVLSSPPSKWFVDGLRHHDHHNQHHGEHHRGRHHRHHGRHHDDHHHHGEHHHDDHHGKHHRHRHGGHHGDHHGRHHGDRHKHIETKHHEVHRDLGRHQKKHGHHCKHRHHHHHHHHRHHDDYDHERYFKACKFDVRRFCYDVDGFVDKMACLASHQDELSDSCHMVLNRCPAFHCAHDVQKFCPGVKNKHEFIGCLWEHRHELSDECMNQDHGGDGHDHLQDKCRREREKFCPEDQKKSPKHDIKCLSNQNKDELSDDCRKSLHIRVACQDEVKMFCSSGSSYPLKCLKQHEQDLGDECKAALANPEKKLIDFSSMLSKPSMTNYNSLTACIAILLTALITSSLVILTCRKRKTRDPVESQYQRI